MNILSVLRSFTGRDGRSLVVLFFVLYFFLGLAVFDDYGVSWDEDFSRSNGEVSVKYALYGDERLFAHWEKYHGPVFEMFLYLMEKAPGITENPRAAYLMRHLATFLLFYAGMWFFYLLCKRRFRSRKVALLGCVFLLISPRIFAHSFYNSKDIAFLSLFIISIYTLLRYLDKKTFFRASIHALVSALLIDVRIMGLIIPVFTLVFAASDLCMKGVTRKRRQAGSLFLYAVFLPSLVVLFWPTLWSDPLGNFIQAIKQMKSFPWEAPVLYLGEYVRATNLPWHYIPVWLVITTPVLYTLFFLAGCSVEIRSMLKGWGGFYRERREDLIYLLWFFLPLVTVIGAGTVLYDSWRHMFFIYPAFLILSLVGMVSMYDYVRRVLSGRNFQSFKTLFILAVILNLIFPSVFMIIYHPHQNVFFNWLAGKDMDEIKRRFELDYWGLSYRKGLEYILANDPAEEIRILAATPPGVKNAVLIPPEDRKRLIFAENPDEADYYISDYRWHREEYDLENEFYAVNVGNAKILVVYKLR